MPEPTEIDDLLFVQQIDAQRRFERSWGDIQAYLRSVLHMVGVDPIEAEELTVLPGAEEVLALLEVRDHVRSGRWDVIVVDCAPTAETLRLLALPEALNWYLDRIFNAERKVRPAPSGRWLSQGFRASRCRTTPSSTRCADCRATWPTSALCWPAPTPRCGWC